MANDNIDERMRDCYESTDPRTNTALAQSLAGKNILIAGAGRGIGRACAEFFSYCSPKSISLAALEQDEVDEVAQACKAINSTVGTKTKALDVVNVDSVRTFVQDICESFGGVDVMVMNAGRPPQWLPMSEGDPNLWWNSVEIGIRGSYNFSRFVLPIMQKQKSGTVILTASAGAHGNAGYSAYTIAKLGMVRLAEIIHAENYKEYNICSFALSPGAVPTRMYTDFVDKSEGRTTPGSYIVEGAEGEDKSVAIAIEHFKMLPGWDSVKLSAGMMTVLASGQLNFLSGRYIDSAVKVEKYLQQKEEIVTGDQLRVRLNNGSGGLIPVLRY